MIYVDANYWIYWFDRRFPEHKYVMKTMRAAIHEGIVLNLVTLMEVAHYLRHLPREDFRQKTLTMQSLATLKFVNLDLDLAELAFEQLMEYTGIGVGGRDSVILATMKATATRRIATHDEVFKKIENLEVVDSIPQSER